MLRVGDHGKLGESVHVGIGVGRPVAVGVLGVRQEAGHVEVFAERIRHPDDEAVGPPVVEAREARVRVIAAAIRADALRDVGGLFPVAVNEVDRPGRGNDLVEGVQLPTGTERAAGAVEDLRLSVVGVALGTPVRIFLGDGHGPIVFAGAQAGGVHLDGETVERAGRRAPRCSPPSRFPARPGSATPRLP